jgi:hypothetical protein
MKNEKSRSAWRGRAVPLVVGIVLTFGAGAQSPTPSTKSAAPSPAAAQATKPAMKYTPPEFKMVLEPRAMDLLKATSAKLAAAKSMSFTATVSYEYPSRLGPPIVYTSRYDVAMVRPDRLRVIMPGDGPASEFYYDGKAMLAYAPAENLVAVADAPPTIDATLRAAFEKAAIYYPFTDLVVADPFAALTDGAMLAFTIGQSDLVGGTRTDMVAWANDDVFLQMWIGADDKLPRRIRAVYRTDPYALGHQMDLSNWQLDGQLAPDAFVSQKAQSAKRIAFASPAGTPPAGAKPPAKATQAKPAPSGSTTKTQ